MVLMSLIVLCAADTPIEEFTPTPAFPALQYLESVDEGGVAWQAGLRTGDFLIEVRQKTISFPFPHQQVDPGPAWLSASSLAGFSFCTPGCLYCWWFVMQSWNWNNGVISDTTCTAGVSCSCDLDLNVCSVWNQGVVLRPFLFISMRLLKTLVGRRLCHNALVHFNKSSPTSLC